MAKTKKSVKKKNFTLLWLAILLATASTIATVAFIKHNSARVPYTVEQQVQFFEDELKPILIEGCAEGKTPYPMINERYQKLNAELTKKFGKRLNINLVTGYHVLSTNIEMSTGLQTNGTPDIAVFVPAFMDMFEVVKQKHGERWHSLFKTHILAIFMHEMEHTPNADILTSQVDIAEESRARSETCRYTLKPLVYDYKLTLIATEANMMKHWAASGENTNSAEWSDYVTRLHSGLISTSAK